ncbi:MAG: cytochrome c3 family protein [Thermodesulfobacteriota bacterium]|nr:cytochrome c3 family protein [Thermodesulfobacteriota bacterium]
MKKKALLVLMVAALGVAFLFAGVYATQQAPDNVTMHSPVFEKHKKALVTFTHKKHNVDYKIACADCHHVYKDGKNVWKEGDEVKKCMACHSEAKAPKAKEGAPKLSKKEKIKKYYYSAIHENCVGCHKALKKAAKPTGPTACKECHPKK